jgi:hypothetical protein
MKDLIAMMPGPVRIALAGILIGILAFAGLEIRYALASDFDRHLARERVQTIFDLLEQAQENNSPDWVCRAINKEFIDLCSESPDHYLCDDPDAKREILTKAGCN